MARKERGKGRGRKGAAGARRPLPKTLVLCQGTETEPKYFRLFTQAYRCPHVKIATEALDPEGLVETAGTRVRHDKAVTRVFVVVDVDDFTSENLRQAVKACGGVATRTCTVDLVVSNESFDCWLAAHVVEQNLPAHGRAHFQKKLVVGGHLRGRNGKVLSDNFPVEDWEKAEQRIASLELNEVGDNPGSAMPTLLRALLPE
ncbi:RloB domain-containing protein [Corynebacterium variabile]|uniref:RloB domain-containing protein n=1 Tax=Corynebacterium variabile TaxID=1727 RepID=UPI003BB00C47